MSAADIKWQWTDAFMRWLTGCAVLLCGLGFVAPAFSANGEVHWLALAVGLFLSAGCALCLLLSNASAANAQIYFASGRWLSGLGAAGVFLGGGAVSMTSMHTGWVVFSGWASGYPLPADEHMTWAFAFIAYVKPVVNWNIQALKDIKGEREAAELAAAKAEAAARQPPPQAPRQPFRPEVVEGGRPSHVAATAVALVAASASQAQAQPADLPPLQPPVLETVSHSAKTWADAAAHAEHLLKIGASQREVSRQTGLTRYRVGQIAGSVAA